MRPIHHRLLWALLLLWADISHQLQFKLHRFQLFDNKNHIDQPMVEHAGWLQMCRNFSHPSCGDTRPMHRRHINQRVVTWYDEPLVSWWPRIPIQFWRIKYLPLLCGDWQGQWSSLANWLCQLGKWNIWMGRNNTVDSGETKIWIQTNHRYLPMLGADWGQLKKQPILIWAICDLCTAECRVSPIPTGYFLSIGLFLQPIFFIWLQTNRQTQQLNATIVTCRRLPLSLEKSLKA